MEHANHVQLVQELWTITIAVQISASLMKFQERMELVVSVHSTIECQLKKNASRTHVMTDKEFLVMVPVNTVRSIPELFNMKAINVVQILVLTYKEFFQMEHVKIVHHTPKASKECFVDLMPVQVGRESCMMVL